MTWLKKYISSKKEEMQQQNIAHIRASFDIEERNGAMWLTHAGVAFMKVDDYTSASQAAKMLNEARDCAIEFDGK